MNGWLFFLLGLLFTVPLNIASSYLIGPFQKWLDSSRASVSGRRKRQLRAEYQRIKAYHDDPSQLHTYVFGTIMFVLVNSLMAAVFFMCTAIVVGVTVVDSLVPGVFGAQPQTINRSMVGLLTTSTTALITMAVSLLTIAVRAAARAMTVNLKVERFAYYERRTLEVLGKDASLKYPDDELDDEA